MRVANEEKAHDEQASSKTFQPRRQAVAASALLSSAAARAYESSAKEAILVDITGRRVLYEKNADEHMPTSSMSKMMTIYMVFDALKKGKVKLDDTLTVSEKAWRTTYKEDESSMFLPIGAQVKIEDLIRGVIIQSGNDATVVLAEGLGGSEAEFMTELNAKAQQLGMTNSHFVNPDGMPDPEHYSTARATWRRWPNISSPTFLNITISSASSTSPTTTSSRATATRCSIMPASAPMV